MAAPDITTGLSDGTYKYLHEPRLGGGTDDQGEYLIQGYYVPWEYRREFSQLMLSTSSWIGGAGGFWQIGLPYQHPTDTGLYAFNTRWEADGALTVPSNPIEYEFAKVYVTFRTPFWNLNGGPGGSGYDPQSFTTNYEEQQLLLWATQDCKYSTEIIEVPQGKLVLAGYQPDGANDAPPTVPQTVPVGVLDLFITYQRVPYFPDLTAYFDKVNLNTFLGIGPGKMFFQGYETSSRAWVDGTRTKTISLHFRARTQDWNKRLGPDFAWYPLMRDGDVYDGTTLENNNGKVMFNYVDFKPMLFLGSIAA